MVPTVNVKVTFGARKAPPSLRGDGLDPLIADVFRAMIETLPEPSRTAEIVHLSDFRDPDAAA